MLLRAGRLRPSTSPWRMFSSTASPLDKKSPVYITTPIFYVNSSPHIGHLYSSLMADGLARWHRMKGHRVLFSTGTDEHGLKVQQAAEKAGVECNDFCDDISGRFRHMFDQTHISYDDYVRTTEERHKAAVDHLWNRLMERGHIYLGEYRGWYCTSDESYLTELQVKDAVDAEGKSIKVSAESGHPVEMVVEENYKFRLSSFREPLLEWLAQNPDAIVPVSRRKEVERLLRDGGLDDLSVSRKKDRLQWAIPTPGDEGHVVYVWLDALVNYLTVAGYPSPSSEASLVEGADDDDDADALARCWPPAYHILGKDILKFHAVFWPAFLLAAGLPLPKRLAVHAHWTVEKVKMSKSLGNVVAPLDLVEQFSPPAAAGGTDIGVDALRYFLLREGGMSDDADFCPSLLRERTEAELADTLGNLVSRVTGKALVPSRVIPQAAGPCSEEDEKLLGVLQRLPAEVDRFYCTPDFRRGVDAIMGALHAANAYVNQNEPWRLNKELRKLRKLQAEGAGDDTAAEVAVLQQRLDTVLCLSMHAARISSLLLLPIIPSTAGRILSRLGVSEDGRTATDADLPPALNPTGDMTVFCDAKDRDRWGPEYVLEDGSFVAFPKF